MTTLLTNNVALLACAPNGIQKLRSLIRRLAVMGRLTGSESEPCAVKEWRHTTFGQVFSLEYGASLPAPKRTGTGEFPVYGSNGVVGSHAECCVAAPCLVVGRKGSAGAVNVCEHHGCWVTDVAYYCVPPDEVTLRFTYLLFLTLGLDELGKGIKPGLSRNEAYVLPISIPPLAEQHRIVAKVDEMMALCDRLETRQSDAQAAHARLVDELLGSLLQARDAEDFAECWGRVKDHFDVLFTTEASIDSAKQAILRLAFAGHLLDRTFGADPKRPDSLPEGWREVQISDIALVGTGATPARTNPAYFEPPEFYWVTSGETSSELINTAAQRVSALALAETNLTLYPPGTLIVAMYGQGKTRGQVSELAIEACTNQACAAIQLKEPSPAHRQYVKYFFEKSYDDLRDLAAGGAQPNLNLGKIKTTLIPLPSLADQHRIVAKLDELLDLCDRLKARIRQVRQVQERLVGALVEQAVS